MSPSIAVITPEGAPNVSPLISAEMARAATDWEWYHRCLTRVADVQYFSLVDWREVSGFDAVLVHEAIEAATPGATAPALWQIARRERPADLGRAPPAEHVRPGGIRARVLRRRRPARRVPARWRVYAPLLTGLRSPDKRRQRRGPSSATRRSPTSTPIRSCSRCRPRAGNPEVPLLARSARALRRKDRADDAAVHAPGPGQLVRRLALASGTDPEGVAGRDFLRRRTVVAHPGSRRRIARTRWARYQGAPVEGQGGCRVGGVRGHRTRAPRRGSRPTSCASRRWPSSPTIRAISSGMTYSSRTRPICRSRTSAG